MQEKNLVWVEVLSDDEKYVTEQLKYMYFNANQCMPSEFEELQLLNKFRMWCGGTLDRNRINDYWIENDPLVRELAMCISNPEVHAHPTIIARLRTRVADLLLWPWKQYMKAWMCVDDI
ncbi:MAG: hypothetical protein ABL890_04100 [Candidatus Peribacteraceae bacterium]